MSVAITKEKESTTTTTPAATSDLGYTILEGKARWAITPKPFTADDKNDMGRKRGDRIGYLEGLR